MDVLLLLLLLSVFYFFFSSLTWGWEGGSLFLFVFVCFCLFLYVSLVQPEVNLTCGLRRKWILAACLFLALRSLQPLGSTARNLIFLSIKYFIFWESCSLPLSCVQLCSLNKIFEQNWKSFTTCSCAARVLYQGLPSFNCISFCLISMSVDFSGPKWKYSDKFYWSQWYKLIKNVTWN